MTDRKLTVIVGAAFLVAAIAAIVAVYAVRSKDGAGGLAKIGGPFTLVDQDGRQRTDEDFRGRYMLVYFGYTFCPDVCPTELTDMANAIQALGPLGDKIQPIFITIDPARDTVAKMKSYVPNFGPRLIGLTGTPEQISKVAKEYRVYYAKGPDPEGDGDYLMDHSSIIYLMGPDGRYVTHFGAGGPPEKMVERLRELVS